MQKRVVNALVAATVLAAPLSGQMGRGPAGSMSRSVTSFGGRGNQHNSFPRAVYWGAPFWADDFSSPYAQPPSVIVVQPAPAATISSTRPMEESKPITPLMIEWQGDRYVRRTLATGSSRDSEADYAAESRPQVAQKHTSAATLSLATAPSTELAATFVFRDGHREQSSDYSIISGVVYARGNYWTDGYWAKQIPVSQLDVPATFKANQERGVTFRLPAAPNEVVTRP
jgi:hypothetical protein